ncbi:hypothetical protein ACH41H_36505 [Streptomyces sp. NPDC020800]|uniref:hypothetical protein n=1 Tax=Streptomyces sp. NPDC020800 TaxID=3365092 RepID=UPI00378B824B
MTSSIFVRDSGDLRRISRELRAMDDKKLKAKFRRELRKAAQPLVPKVRQSIRNIPSQQAYSPDGLRAALSRATRVEVKTTGREAGVAIRVDGRKMPAHMKSLPSMVEGKKRWRHPVFGHDVWVDQPKQPYFYNVVRSAGVQARRAVNRVLDDISREIS